MAYCTCPWARKKPTARCVSPLSRQCPPPNHARITWTFCKLPPAPGRATSNVPTRGITKFGIPCNEVPPGCQRLDRPPPTDEPQGYDSFEPTSCHGCCPLL